MKNNEKIDDIIDYVFTPYITLKNGKRIYAFQYGKKVFRFPRKNEENVKG